ncbi:MAG: hypothetical protein Q4G35_04790 [Propionibacteriaceae bacterium]|nr:hypothetical protein [Propionibacteriaceae bacterium]
MDVILQTAIDARALGELLDQSPRMRMALHRILTNLLLQHSQLVWSDQADTNELVQALRRQADPDVGRLWAETLKALERSGRMRTLRPGLDLTTGQACDSDPLASELADALDLVVVSSSVLDKKGLGATGYGQMPGEPELAALEAVDSCDSVRKVRALHAGGGFPSGTDRETVWRTVMLPLARASREVTLFDRYLLERFGQGSYRANHVSWLIERLDQACAPNSTVRLLCALNDSHERGTIGSDFEREVIRAPLKNMTVKLVMAPWKAGHGDRGAHNRHLRFSCGMGLAIEEGFDRFGSARISGPDGFALNPLTTADALTRRCDLEEYVTGHPDRAEYVFL